MACPSQTDRSNGRGWKLRPLRTCSPTSQAALGTTRVSTLKAVFGRAGCLGGDSDSGAILKHHVSCRYLRCLSPRLPLFRTSIAINRPPRKQHTITSHVPERPTLGGEASNSWLMVHARC